jgi:pimeloyl-ACP methyl ester carboxylesterase
MFRLAVLVLAAAAASLPAQSPPFAVGRRDVGWTNTTGSGASTLSARVHYPATSGGTNTPILPRSGGWPVVVFLHGFAALGSFYGSLGDALAAEGYVAVMSNTSQFDNVGQERDGRALFSALTAAVNAAGGPFENALDLGRVGLAGHSMGGGNTANVLANNPGYRCGFAFAPVDARTGNAAAVAVPFGIVVGTGDSTTPWQTTARPLYQGLTAYTGIKMLCVLNGDCNHTNVAGLFVSGSPGTEVFARTRDTALAFFARYLRGEAAGLEQVLGVSARAEPRLTALFAEVETPELWPAAPIRTATANRISVAAEPGACGVLAAPTFGSTPTPFGELRLDAASAFLAFAGTASAERRFDATLVLPADPSLIGARLPAQAFGPSRDAAFELGSATELAVVN